MQLFYGHKNESGQILLDENESRHLKVLRRQIGDQMHICDGEGSLYTAKITKLGKNAEAEIIHDEFHPPRLVKLHLFVSPTKNMDRMEWMVEKCVEIGLESITFIQCRYSERKNLKTDRLERKAVSAIKQAKQFYLPEINELQSFDKALANASKMDIYIAHCEEDQEKLKTISKAHNSDIAIFIGPEGDFSEEEISLAHSHGAQALSLGDSILRTETAAMVATCLFNFTP